MRAPLSWLQEMTPIDPAMPPADIAARLSSLGLVVEAMHPVGEGLSDVVVARVLEISPIEGADRIRRVVVDAGGRELGIVCGAWNFSHGDLVPLAPVGAVLPGGMEIGRRKMRGVASEGMLCSPRELGLSDDGAGLLVLEPGPTPGTPISDALGIVRDVVFELEIAPNRPDALSIAGIARDLAAGLGLPFVLPDPYSWLEERQSRLEGSVARPEASSLARVEIQAPELCTRLTGRVLLGIAVGPSPAIVARRLTLCGMRPINALVDASNYVMLELGQPTHPYDLELVRGGLVARAASEGESIVTLDGARRELRTSDCVIADGEGKAIGVGGVMGGMETEITEATTAVLLEAAHFTPLAIARTARRLGLRTEASVRFERGCDPEVVELAQARFCELVLRAAEASGASAERAPVVAHGLLDARPAPAPPTVLRVRTEKINGLLGTSLDDEEVDRLLAPIGFAVTRSVAGVADVVVPSFRPDVTGEVDVIEEVARMHGYESIASSQLRAPGVGRLTAHQQRRRELRRLLAALGAHEAWTPTFVSPEDHARAMLPGDEVRLSNPLATEESVLRKGLLPGLLKALVHNAARRNPDCRFFEIGHIFGAAEDGGLPRETEVAAVVLAFEGDDASKAVQAWRFVADGLAVDEVTMERASPHGLHPTRSAYLREGGRIIGAVGEVDPQVLRSFELPHERVGWLVMALEPLLDLAGRSRSVQPLSRFPSSDIDLAFVVDDDVPADAVEAVLALAAGELCQWVSLFDVYRGQGIEPGKRSLAFRLRFCADDRTLTDAEVADLRQQCIRAVEESYPAVLRG